MFSPGGNRRVPALSGRRVAARYMMPQPAPEVPVAMRSVVTGSAQNPRISAVMHCPACQGQVESADRHCRHCGAALCATEATATPPRAAASRLARVALAAVALAAIAVAWMAWQHGAMLHQGATVQSGQRVPVAGDRPVDPVVAVSHAAVSLISIIDEYFDATGELPLSLSDTGFSPADVHAGIAVDYERDTGRIHVASADGRYRFSAVLESPEEGDSWWVCVSDTLPGEEWPARCRAPEPPAVPPESPATGDGAEEKFPLGEGTGGEAEAEAPVSVPAPARIP